MLRGISPKNIHILGDNANDVQVGDFEQVIVLTFFKRQQNYIEPMTFQYVSDDALKFALNSKNMSINSTIKILNITKVTSKTTFSHFLLSITFKNDV